MAEIWMNAPEVEVKNKDVEFGVYENGSKLGTLRISRGDAEWLPANNHVNKYKLSWSKLAELFCEHGR